MVHTYGAYDRGDPAGLTISGLTLSDGFGASAGAIYTDGDTNVALANDVITGNTATGQAASFSAPVAADYGGGAITSTGIMSIASSTISGNASSTAGSGKYGGGGIEALGPMAISGSAISGNTATGQGGGILVGTGKYAVSPLQLTNSTVSGNTANYGGGIAFFQATKYGSSRDQVLNTTISGNTGTNIGGGIALDYLGGASRLTVSHSTISGNNGSSGSAGGGLAAFYAPGSFQLVDSTLSGNTAGYGGGVFLLGPSVKYQDSFQFDNSTVASNGASSNGGGFYVTDFYSYNGSTPSTVGVTSTIVADNNGPDGPQDLADESGYAPAVQLSFALVESTGGAKIVEQPAGSNIFALDPQLGGLANNGGPTQTRMPAVTSPVVDKGISPGPLATDQRGDPRRVDTSVPNAADGTDIGAVELSSGPPGEAPGAVPTIRFHNLKKKRHGKRVLYTHHKRPKVHFYFTSRIPGLVFLCRADKHHYKRCKSPFTVRLSSAPGKGKAHRIQVIAVDPATGKRSKPKTIKFRIVRKTRR